MAAAAEPRSCAEADLPWSLQVRGKRALTACPGVHAQHVKNHVIIYSLFVERTV